MHLAIQVFNQALLLDNSAAVAWLTSKGATVTTGDVSLLLSRGIAAWIGAGSIFVVGG